VTTLYREETGQGAAGGEGNRTEAGEEEMWGGCRAGAWRCLSSHLEPTIKHVGQLTDVFG
jgi:hypothetical protein